MKPATIELYKKQLEQSLGELEEEQRSTAGDHKPVALDQSTQGRLSRMDAMQSQEMAKELRRRKEEELRSIRAALKRMDKGWYGKCGLCQLPIADERLEIFPDVLTCVNCA